jgi:hypothetical protein
VCATCVCLNAAPELHITATGDHVVYFVTDELSTGKLVVGVAVSTSGVQGPYKDVLGGPLVATPHSDCFGAIDPTFFTDPSDNTQYVVWKADGNSCGQPTVIYAAPVAANGTTFTGSPAELIRNDQPWEGTITEAPWLVHAGCVCAVCGGAVRARVRACTGQGRLRPWKSTSVGEIPVARRRHPVVYRFAPSPRLPPPL